MEDSHKTPGAIDPVLYSANELYNVRLKTKQTNKNTTHPLRKKKKKQTSKHQFSITSSTQIHANHREEEVRQS